MTSPAHDDGRMRRDPRSVLVEGPALLVGAADALILWPAVRDLALQLRAHGATRKLQQLGPLLTRWQTLVAMAEAAAEPDGRFAHEPVGGTQPAAVARSSRNNGEWCTAAEASQRLGCSAQHIGRLTRRGELDVGDAKAFKAGRDWTIPVAGVEAYLQRKEAAA